MTLIHAEETMFLRSPGDRFIALVSRKDGSAALLSTRSWTIQCQFPAHWYSWLRESAWSPDEDRIAVVHSHGMDGAGQRRFSVRLWEIEDGRLGAELPLGEEPRALLWSRDGRSLAAIGLGRVTVWEAPDWKKTAEWPIEAAAASDPVINSVMAQFAKLQKEVAEPAQSPTPKRYETTGVMDFPTAIRKVIEGNKIRRLEWLDKAFDSVYCFLNGNVLSIHKPDGLNYQWIINDGDLLATDWVVIN